MFPKWYFVFFHVDENDFHVDVFSYRKLFFQSDYNVQKIYHKLFTCWNLLTDQNKEKYDFPPQENINIILSQDIDQASQIFLKSMLFDAMSYVE